jgi:hypothetical protein
MTTQDYKGRTLQARLRPEDTDRSAVRLSHLGRRLQSQRLSADIDLRQDAAAASVSLDRAIGPIPPGMVLCHRCDERRCINPDHHFVGTHQANMDDMTQKRRARRERAAADAKGHGPPPALDVPGTELTPIRIYVRGVEIVGKAVIRPFDPGGKL